jgi:hypothetical protein
VKYQQKTRLSTAESLVKIDNEMIIFLRTGELCGLL